MSYLSSTWQSLGGLEPIRSGHHPGCYAWWTVKQQYDTRHHAPPSYPARTWYASVPGSMITSLVFAKHVSVRPPGVQSLFYIQTCSRKTLDGDESVMAFLSFFIFYTCTGTCEETRSYFFYTCRISLTQTAWFITHLRVYRVSW